MEIELDAVFEFVRIIMSRNNILESPVKGCI